MAEKIAEKIFSVLVYMVAIGIITLFAIGAGAFALRFALSQIRALIGG